MNRALILGLVIALSAGGLAVAASWQSVIDSAYTIGAGARPTCDSTIRGKQWFVEGGVGIADSVSVCVKGALDTYAWSSLL